MKRNNPRTRIESVIIENKTIIQPTGGTKFDRALDYFDIRRNNVVLHSRGLNKPRANILFIFLASKRVHPLRAVECDETVHLEPSKKDIQKGIM